MNPGCKDLLLAAIIIAALIFIAYLSYRAGHWGSGGRSGYTVVSPATPLVVAALNGVVKNIDAICDHGSTYLAATASAPEQTDSAVLAARPVVQAFVTTLESARDRIRHMPPSWDNCAQVYRSLRGGSDAVRATAAGFKQAGYAAHQYIAQNPGDHNTSLHTVAGDALLGIGRNVQSFSASVHNLGATLDLE